MKKLFNYYRNWSIKNKIVLACIFCIVLPMSITTILSYNKSNKIITNEVAVSSHQILNQLKNNIEGNIKEVERLSIMAYSNQKVIDVLKSHLDVNDSKKLIQDRNVIHGFISGMANIKDGFSGVYVFTERNENYSINGIDRNYDFRKQDWYGKFNEQKEKWILLSPHIPMQSYTKEDMVFSLIRPIKDPLNGIKLGFLLIDMNINEINNMCNQTNIGNNGKIIVIDQNNNMIYNAESRNIGEKAELPFELMKDSPSGFIDSKKRTGDLITHITSPYTNWTYISIVPKNELISNTRSIIDYTVIVGLLSVILAAVVSVFFSGAITSPIKKLTQAMKKVESGDMDVVYHYEYKDEIGFLTSSFNNMVINIKELIKKMIDFSVKTKEAELELLQSKINPHFLYNTLQSIQMKAIVDENQELANMVELLGDYMRFSISSVKDIVTLEEELNFLNKYIELQKIRFGEKLNFIAQVDPEALSCKVIKLILQPIIENSIYHGLEKKAGEWKLTLKILVTSDNLVIRVSDNGIGIKNEKLEKMQNYLANNGALEESMGLKNINERLNIMTNGSYSFRIDSIENFGTNVEIILPKIIDNELNV